jgi:hypothetical protein
MLSLGSSLIIPPLVNSIHTPPSYLPPKTPLGGVLLQGEWTGRGGVKKSQGERRVSVLMESRDLNVLE